MPMTNRKGFTLIEVMIAMFLLLIGMLSYAQLQLTAIKVNAASKQMMMAQEVVSQELEKIKTVGYTGIKDNTVVINTSFNYKPLLTGLAANYQLTGIDTSCNEPAAYCVYKGIDVVNSLNGTAIAQRYTIKLAVNVSYLSYPAVAEVDATVYWMNGSTLKNMMIAGFVGI